MNTKVTETIQYIGVDDTDLDLFESQYIVPNGISYNSYLIEDEKIAIMDTVDKRKSGQWWANLTDALEGRTPDYLVVQHMEPDHAGNIADAMERFPQMKIVATIQDAENLLQANARRRNIRKAALVKRMRFILILIQTVENAFCLTM